MYEPTYWLKIYFGAQLNLNKVFENSALMANGEESNQSICTLSLEELNTYNIRPEMQAITFEIKFMMFQMLQTIGQFHGRLLEDPPTSKVNFRELVTHFNSMEWLGLFPYSLKDCAKSWLNTLNSLAESFLIKYFSSTRNSWFRNEIVSFQQFENETLSEALERFK